MADMRTRNRQSRIRGCILFILLTVGFPAGNMPWAAEKWFEQGLVELKNGYYQRAADAFTLAIESAPHDFEAYNNRGFAKIYTGDYDGAIADCSQAIQYNPGSAKAYNNRGFAYIFKESYEMALSDFDRAIAINPRYVDAHSNRCLAEIRQQRYAHAVKDCSQALAINPRSAKALYNRGFARDRQGDHAGALDDYIQALKINPDYIEVFNNIAWILATSQDERLRDGPRAVALAEKALAHTTDVNFLDTLAAAYAEAGRYDEAVAMENRVVSILAARGTVSDLRPHVERLSLYEEGRPYRDPVKVQSVSAVTDLNHKFEALDRLIQPPSDQAAADRRPEGDHPIAESETAAKTVSKSQAPPDPPDGELRVVNQTVSTPPGEPVDITLHAESNDRLPITFDIETPPFQGALRGTLPNLIYSPRAGFTGTDRFTYRAANAAGRSQLATIVINVGGEPESASVALNVTAAPEPDSGHAPKEAAPLPETEEDKMPTPAVSLPTEPMPGTAAVKPAESKPQIVSVGTTTSVRQDADASSPGADPVGGYPEVLAADSRYTLQVRSIKEPDIAKREIGLLRGDGYEAFSQTVEIPGKGTWHRIFVNTYATMADARQGLAGLDQTRFKGAHIRRIPADLRQPVTTPAAPPEASATDEAVASTDKPLIDAPAVSSDKPAADENPRTTFPYAFQIKSYREKDDAFQLGVELTSLGRRAFIGVSRLGTTGDWYRVYVGCFSTTDEGEKMRNDLAADGFEDAFLTVIPYTIVIRPPDHDPSGETLENQLLAKNYLPYRLSARSVNRRNEVLVGGFQRKEEALATLKALQDLGHEARLEIR
jgi:tetratricopeptide (TPR) repeat protein/cell division septation protein DedD